MLNKIEHLKTFFYNRRIMAILCLGFSAGIPLALTGSLLSMWLSRLGIDVKTIGLFSLAAVPFSFKYLWSSVFDYVPLPFFTKKFGLRRGWLIFTQISLMVCIFALGSTSPTEHIEITALVALLVSFSSASQDIVIDALRIEVLEEQEQALGATMYVYGYRIAMLVSGGGALLLADHMSWNLVYFFMGLTILIGYFAVLSLNEPTHSVKKLANLENFHLSYYNIIQYFKNAKWLHCLFGCILGYKLMIFLADFTNASSSAVNNITITYVLLILFYLYKQKTNFISKLPEPILDFCTRPNWLKIVLFVVFYKIADTLVVTVQSKFYVTMGFSNTEIAYITKGLGTLMIMIGLLAGGIIYYKIGTFNSLLLAGILQMSSNLLFIWVAQEQHNIFALTFTIAIENFTGAINNVVIVAYLSSLCNLAYTATQYAMLSSLSTIGRTIISAPAGYLVEHVGWANFFAFTTLAGIPGIVLLIMIFRKKNEYSYN